MSSPRHSVGSIWLGTLVSSIAWIAQAQPAAPSEQNENQWPTYGGNLASHRYSPLDQIDKDNFKDLRIAWRLRTDFLGARPDTLYSATPLYMNDTLYTTAGTRRAVVALDPATGDMLWMHGEDEGARGAAAAGERAAASPGGRAGTAPTNALSMSHPATA